MMNKLKKPANAPMVLIVVVILIIAGYFVTKQVKDYLALSQHLQQIEVKLNQYPRLKETLEAERGKLVVTQANLEQYTPYFNKALQEGELLTILGNEAANHQVNITQITPKEVTKSEHYQQLPLQMAINGDYHNILLYLQWLENLAEWANYSEIVAFSITPAEEAAQSLDVVDCNLTLTLYSSLTPTEEIHNHGKNGGQ